VFDHNLDEFKNSFYREIDKINEVYEQQVKVTKKNLKAIKDKKQKLEKESAAKSEGKPDLDENKIALKRALGKKPNDEVLKVVKKNMEVVKQHEPKGEK
jgi:hypothetical protein